MDAKKLAVLFASTGEDAQAHQEGLQNIEAFFAKDTGPFEQVEIITGEGLSDVNVPEIKNHCLAKAAECGADWCLVMDPTHRLAPESPKLLAEAFGQFQGIWGLFASFMPQKSEYSIRIPQILTMERAEDLLIFDPMLALQGPYYVRADAALEVKYDPRQNIAWDLDFALRFWPGHTVRKLPTLIGGALEMSEAKFNAYRSVSQELVLKSRKKAGLVRETPAIIQRVNEKVLELQAYCRGERAIPADKVAELSQMLPFRGLMDISMSQEIGFHVLNMNDDEVANQMAWTGAYKNLATSLWTALAVQNPGLILDCGAYNGLYGMIAAACSPQSLAICIEPEREAFARILLSLQSNTMQNISAVQYALDATAGVTSLFRLTQKSGLCLYSAIHPQMPCPMQEGQFVHSITVDNLLIILQGVASEQTPNVTLAKMNLCGNESPALMGMIQTLEGMHPHLLISIYPSTDTRTVQQLLSAKGYSIYHLDEEKMGINPVTNLPAAESPYDVLATTLSPEQLQQQLKLVQGDAA